MRLNLAYVGVGILLLTQGCGQPSNVQESATASYVKQLNGILVMNDISTPGTPLAQVSIFTVRADGTNKKMLTGPGNQFPSWTPDGQIIFVSNRSGSPQIWIMDEDGSNPQQIGNLNLEESGQTIFPAFQRVQMARNGLIAFLHSGDGIWLMQKDGSGLRELVKFRNGAGDAPALALSATWLTFTAPADATPGHTEIFRINTDGTGLQQLTFPTDPNYPDANASSISPDESKVAIYTGTESHPGDSGFSEYHNIGVIQPNGGSRKLLTACHPVPTQQEQDQMRQNPDDCVASDNPSWSPDGQWIIYDRGSLNPDASGTWAIDRNGNNRQRLNPGFPGGGSVPFKFTE
jgi:Tol biopolymer transport system component